MTGEEEKKAAELKARILARSLVDLSILVIGVVLLATGCALQWGWPMGIAVVGAALICEMKLGD